MHTDRQTEEIVVRLIYLSTGIIGGEEQDESEEGFFIDFPK